MDFLFGSEPEATVSTQTTLTPQQQQVLKKLLGVVGGSEGVGGLDSDFGLGASPLELSSLEALSQLTLPQTGGENSQAAIGAATAGLSSLEELFTSGPRDIDAYFKSAVQDPLLEQFSETILPELQTKHASSFFGGERREAESRSREDLLDTLVRERSNVAFEELNNNIKNKIAGASVAPGLGDFATNQPFNESNQQINQLLSLLQAGGSSANIQQRQLDERNRRLKEALAAVGLPAIENIGQTTGGSSGFLTSLISSPAAAAAVPLIFSSSKKMKEELGDADLMLEALEKLPIKTWRYKKETGLGTEPHVGPYAEDFQEIFGLGDGKTLNVIDLHGINFAATKALAAKVKALEELN